MTILQRLLARLGDGLDLAFESAALLWGVLSRGAFSADARSYRSSRFMTLSPEDVLVQEVGLNAADAGEARKAIMLDADNVLPVPVGELLIDVTGPLSVPEGAERRFIVGAVRKARLAALRDGLAPPRRRRVEGFIYRPAQRPCTLRFEDDVGRALRRPRRLALACALLALGLAAGDLARAGEESVTTRLAAMDAERLSAERRVRLAQHRLERARAMAAALQQSPAVPIMRVSAALERLAANQPSDAELQSVRLEGGLVTLEGRSNQPPSAELALRRAFEGASIGFAVTSESSPAAYRAQIEMHEDGS